MHVRIYLLLHWILFRNEPAKRKRLGHPGTFMSQWFRRWALESAIRDRLPHGPLQFYITVFCVHENSFDIHLSTKNVPPQYNDVIMGAIVSQITSLPIVYSVVYSGADQRKHQSSASLTLCGEFTGTDEIPRQVFMGSPKDNTSARPCIAEDGPTGSFLECSGLDIADEKSVRNEGWSHNG